MTKPAGMKRVIVFDGRKKPLTEADLIRIRDNFKAFQEQAVKDSSVDNETWNKKFAPLHMDRPESR